MLPDEEGEFRGTGGFTRNIIIIAALHLLGLGVLVLFTLHPFEKKEEQLVWMNPGSFGSNDSSGGPAPSSTPEAEESPETSPESSTPTPPLPTPEPETPTPPPE